MYKKSKYNHIILDNNIFYIYNILTGKVANIENKKIREFFLLEKNQDEYLPYIDELILDGFIILDFIDEDYLFNLRNLDMIVNKDLELIIVPTTNCNFKCTYCYEKTLDKKMNNETLNSILKYIKRNIKDFNALKISWFGGEPLLEVETINNLSKQLIQMCHIYNKSYIASITTNGYLLTENIFKSMLNNHIYLFIITLDGLEKVHDSYRYLYNNNGSFKKIIFNLRNIHNNIKSNYFKIRIRINVTKTSLTQIPEFINFLDKEFGNDKRFEFLFFPVLDWGKNSNKEILLKSFDEIYNLLIDLPIKLNYNPLYDYLQPSICCASKRNSYIIAPDGIIKKCTMTISEENYNIGYLSKNGDMFIEKYLLAKWINIKKTNKNSCTNCNNKQLCDISCPLIRNFQSEDYNCEYKTLNINSIIKLLYNDKQKKSKIYKE